MMHENNNPNKKYETSMPETQISGGTQGGDARAMFKTIYGIVRAYRVLDSSWTPHSPDLMVLETIQVLQRKKSPAFCSKKSPELLERYIRVADYAAIQHRLKIPAGGRISRRAAYRRQRAAERATREIAIRDATGVSNDRPAAPLNLTRDKIVPGKVMLLLPTPPKPLRITSYLLGKDFS